MEVKQAHTIYFHIIRLGVILGVTVFTILIPGIIWLDQWRVVSAQFVPLLAESRRLIYADKVHTQIGITGRGVMVALIDTGIDYTHPDLGGCTQDQFLNKQCQKVVDGWDFIGDDPDPLETTPESHGTHVAGIIASPQGIAPDAKLVVLRVETDLQLIRALEWIIQKKRDNVLDIKIVNISKGMGLFETECDSQFPEVLNLVDQLMDLGVVVFAATGNDGQTTKIAFPACLKKVIAVAAVYDRTLKRPILVWNVCREKPVIGTFVCANNRNANLDLLAPGDLIRSTDIGGGYREEGGTSAAAPHAAGVAALMLEAKPSLPADAIGPILALTGNQIRDPATGLIFPRVNALAAVRRAKQFNRPPIANAGPDQTVQVGSTVQLDGGGSYDPDGDPLRFHWRFISKPRGSMARLSNSRILNPTFIADKEGEYILELMVQDSRRARSSDQVKITAQRDITPPALITNFQASDNEDSQSTLTWTNPSDGDLAQIVVKRKTTGYPANHDDGETRLTIDSATPSRAETFVDTSLANGTTYFYAVFSRDQAGNWNDQVVEGQNADTGTPQTVIIINGHPWPMGNYDAQNTSRSQNLGPNSPTVAWSTNLGLTERVIVAGDGTLYLSRDNDVCAVQGQTITWCFPTPQFYRRPPAIGADGTVYAGAVVRNPDGTASGRLYAINPDGSPKWEINLTWLPSSPIVGPDGGIYVSAGDTLYAVNPDGSVRWTFTMPGISFLPYPPALGSDDTVYATVDRSENYGSPGLYAINPNGSKKWFVNTTAMPTSPPVVDTTDGSIYVARTLVAPCWAREALIALRPDGSLKWQFDQWNCGFRVGTPAVGPDGTVYVTQGALWAFDPNTGQPKWSFHPGGFGFSETVAIDTEGIIYVGASYGTLYALRSNGEVKWQVTFNPGQNIWYGASIGADRTIYIQTISFLYAIGEGSVNRSSHGVSRISQRIVNNEERIRDFEFHIFNLTGRLVFHIRQIADGFVWNGLDMQGRTVPNGVYLVVITTRRDDGTIIKREVKKLVILR